MYIYKIENKINGKVYIGQCTKSITESKNYYGSGKLIQLAIKKYGIDNFEKTILCECDNRKELNLKEIEYISKFNTIETGYNISIGGNGGDLGDIVNKKISETVKLAWKTGSYDMVDYGLIYRGPVSDEVKKKISDAQKGDKGFWYGKTFSESHKLKIKINTKTAYETGAYDNLLTAMRSDDVRKKISDSLKGNIPWNKGKTNVYTDDQRAKMSQSASNRNIKDETEIIRRNKISEYFSNNHPNVVKILDTRDNCLYKSVKDFCIATNTSWYKTKKLRKDGIIEEIK